MPEVLLEQDILAKASDVLIGSGYSQAPNPPGWSGSQLLFEDDFGVVAVNTYATWSELSAKWPASQAQFVKILADRFEKSDPKIWDGYLVLLTPAPSDDAISVAELRCNTTRFRKLVASGNDLHSLDDVRTVLLPVLSINTDAYESSSMAVLVGELPLLLRASRIDLELADVVIDAFRRSESVVQRMYARGASS